MKIIVMGCGKVGEQLCRMLDKSGHQVTVIDSDASNLNRLSANFSGVRVQGVGFDKDILLQAGIEQAEAFAATSPVDNANIIAARIAQNIYHVPRVVARLYDPRRAEIYRRLGLVTISMTTWGAERINEFLTHTNLDTVQSYGRGEVSMASIEISSLLDDHAIKDLNIPGEIQVCVVTRDGEAFIPDNLARFRVGDIVHVAVHSASMDKL
ncbi:MAG: TrkA family potassium uptake protein, partial [Anaerolineae bacterium]|nr:TrkA family potassium uptake protein [Anaerolineae bacterium]